MSDDSGTTAVSTTTTVVAGVLAAVYLGATAYMFFTFAVAEPPEGANWDHAFALFAGIQSVGFAAIGVLLGTAVQQPRIVEAKAGEKKAKDAIRSALPGGEAGGGGANLELTPAQVAMLKAAL